MKNEPVITAAAVASAIVTLANVAGVEIDLSILTNVIVVVATLLAAVGVRSKVTPV